MNIILYLNCNNYKDKRIMTDNQLKLKIKFDTVFDNLFYSKEFKDAMIKKFGIVPAGLTFDTRFDDDVSEPFFCLCCKKYGYEFSGERVVGDYAINKYKFTREMFEFCMDYTDNVSKEIYNEMINYDFTY